MYIFSLICARVSDDIGDEERIGHCSLLFLLCSFLQFEPKTASGYVSDHVVNNMCSIKNNLILILKFTSNIKK